MDSDIDFRKDGSVDIAILQIGGQHFPPYKSDNSTAKRILKRKKKNRKIQRTYGFY